MQQIFELQLLTIQRQDDASFLLAVSGGVDSMVMASLFVASKRAKIAVAHVNFGLRGKESDADEALVAEWAQSQNIPCFVKKTDTRNYAANHKLSIEMAARELRYQWFEELRQTLNFDYVAVAHHANDNAETILLNLTRGTGIRGVMGISPARGFLVRPMLSFEREQIEKYARERHIPFRVDATNTSEEFLRNRIRLRVMPELEKINPKVVKRFQKNGGYFREAGEIIDELLEEKRRAWCWQEGEAMLMDIKKIVADIHATFWLFEILYPFGFQECQIKQVTEMLHAKSGSKVLSNTHILYKDRDRFALLPLITHVESCHLALPPDVSDNHSAPHPFTIMLHDASGYVTLPNPTIAALDAEKLHFPLVLRKWQKGDRFIPLGMSGFKKVSDLLIDTKVPLWEKDIQQVLCSDHDIVWVVGRRIDERYKLTEATTKVAEIRILRNPA